METLKKLWAALIAPCDDDEMEYYEAIDMVCRKCKFGSGYCSLCPVKLSYFGSDSLLWQNQVLKENPYDIPKQLGEVRVVSCDFAFVEGEKNNNSISTCDGER